MKFISFNINGLRAHIHQLEHIIQVINPDVIGLQEIKVQDKDFPIDILSKYNYYLYYYGQKSYYGVALLSKNKPLMVHKGLLIDEIYLCQKRTIKADFETSKGILTVINVYFPNGGYRNSIKFLEKKKFYKNFILYLKKYHNKNSLLIVMGDMNIAQDFLDIGIKGLLYKFWLKSGKCGFLPEEQTWVKNLLDFGLIDSYRYFNTLVNNKYSWFDYRFNSFKKNLGLRIDLLLSTKPLINVLESSGIYYNIRNMNKPSDHAPIWSNFIL
ncbi:MAG: exodeoxyribonuclease III [Candidatus Westeberhardia cardiocondylae]|nr:exodeoxyribonuclease III [Candidatus Westeberhardia cardiocondylae]